MDYFLVRFLMRYMVTIAGLLLIANSLSHAAPPVYFPNDPTGWATAVGSAGQTVEMFDTGPNNMALANELSAPPLDDTDLGTELLTFDKANTGLSGSFTFETQDDGQNIGYRFRPTGDLHPFDRPDAVEINITGGQSVYAFAMEIFDLEDGIGAVEIFSGATSLGSTSNLARDPDTFFGVISDEPFDRITYSGTADFQESFSDFQFAFAPDIDPELPGDFNDDLRVDKEDIAIWKDSFDLDAGADADGDADSDGNDFLVWQRYYGTDLNPPEFAAIPEPAAIILLFWRSEERRVGKECRSRWSPYH